MFTVMNKFKNLTILVVDDHPFTSDAYINLISKANDAIKYKFLKATNCEKAFKTIEMVKKKEKKIDIALMDYLVQTWQFSSVKSFRNVKLLC